MREIARWKNSRWGIIKGNTVEKFKDTFNIVESKKKYIYIYINYQFLYGLWNLFCFHFSEIFRNGRKVILFLKQSWQVDGFASIKKKKEK